MNSYTEKINILLTDNSEISNNALNNFKKEIIALFKKIDNLVKLADSNALKESSIYELKELNTSLFEGVTKEAYESSYLNPAYAVKMTDDNIGKKLTLIINEAYKCIEMALATDFTLLDSSISFIIDALTLLNSEDVATALSDLIVKRAMTNCIDLEKNITRFFNPTSSYEHTLITNCDLDDLKYLYLYPDLITDSQIRTAKFFNTLPEEKVESMASTFTEGFKRGFVANDLDLDSKQFVLVYYHIGFERVAFAAAKQFETMNLTPILRVYSYYDFNKQISYDHRFDSACYLSAEYIEKRLEFTKEICEKYKDKLGLFAGPALIERFGEESFKPQNKKEANSFSKEQLPLSSDFSRRNSLLQLSYRKHEESSFSIISYPVPEIGEDFEEILKATIEVNTLDNDVYKDIQQYLIDALDGSDYVHIQGMGDNKTDLNVKILPISDPSKETVFENCLADVNIPVGEVFTSPVLEGTNGTLHVTKVFLNGLLYNDLTIVLKDGMIEDYSCKNFATEEENKKYIKENILFNHETIPIGEFAIGTNTTAYVMGQNFNIQDKLPILIAEKTGPHFAMGDTCFSMQEDVITKNPDGKIMIAKENSCSALRHTDPSKAYFTCHTDITIPYNELGEITAYDAKGNATTIIKEGRFVLKGTELLNEAFKNLK